MYPMLSVSEAPERGKESANFQLYKTRVRGLSSRPSAPSGLAAERTSGALGANVPSGVCFLV